MSLHTKIPLLERLRKLAEATPYAVDEATLLKSAAAYEALEKALRRFLSWADHQCPCSDELPNPCPLCGASVENLEACKARESKFPRDILTEANHALTMRQG